MKHYRPNYIRELDQYQDAAIRTAKYANRGTEDLGALIYPYLKLLEEMSEVISIVTKSIGRGELLTPEMKDKLAIELGDTMWCVAELAEMNGLNLSGIANKNILKLEAREANDELMKRNG